MAAYVCPLGGRIAIIGNRGSININPRGIMGKELQVLGVMLYGASQDEEEEAAAGAFAHQLRGAMRFDTFLQF